MVKVKITQHLTFLYYCNILHMDFEFTLLLGGGHWRLTSTFFFSHLYIFDVKVWITGRVWGFPVSVTIIFQQQGEKKKVLSWYKMTLWYEGGNHLLLFAHNFHFAASRIMARSAPTGSLVSIVILVSGDFPWWSQIDVSVSDSYSISCFI